MIRPIVCVYRRRACIGVQLHVVKIGLKIRSEQIMGILTNHPKWVFWEHQCRPL